MRRALAVLLHSLSILAHGFWRAGSRVHHLFGGLMVLLAAPVAIFTLVLRRSGSLPRDDRPGND